jgi:hypothetical protein
MWPGAWSNSGLLWRDKEQSNGEQHADGELEAGRGGQHGEQLSAVVVAQSEADRRKGHRKRQQGEERPAPVMLQDADRGRRRGEGGDVEIPGPNPAEPDGDRLLARFPVRLDVAQVVGLEERRRQQADGHAHPEGEGPREWEAEDRERTDRALDVGRAGGGHQPEEDEDQHLAEAEVAVGVLASGIGPTRQPAEEADRNEPVGDPDGQDESGHARHSEGRKGGKLHLSHRRQLAGDETDRADANLVGAAHAIGVVVDVVGADLQAERDHQRQERVHDGEAVMESDKAICGTDPGTPINNVGRVNNGVFAGHVAGCRPHHHRHDGGRKCPWARASDPQLQRDVHGRRGNLEKSGLRCSTKALRPSWPSSVM